MFSLLTLLDDMAATFDDVAVMSKIAMKKTSALMSDDLAVNAGVVHGVTPDRELPMVKAIFIGSLWNKVISILGVLGVLAVYEPILKWILLVGGLYLSFEGAHKVIEKLFHKKDGGVGKVKIESEEQKVKGAIKTDLILSIEIIVIAKNAMSGPYMTQVLTLCVVGLAASIIIYGLVGLLVKIDDVGLALIEKGHEKTGSLLVQSMPYTMKGLGIIGTLAMFLVGGGIVMHTFHWPYYTFEMLQNLGVGLVAGLICLIPFEIYAKYKN